MSHDATKVLMGATQSSFKNVDNHKGVIAAGTACRLKSDDTLSIASADGNLLGVSLGADLSSIGWTSICRKGSKVPVLLTSAFTPVIGAQVNISDTTGKAGTAGAGFTAVNAVYVSGILTGMLEDGTTDNVALIDFPGGL
jgi:hypothetical protein